jgi:hypothetical protein
MEIAKAMAAEWLPFSVGSQIGRSADHVAESKFRTGFQFAILFRAVLFSGLARFL